MDKQSFKVGQAPWEVGNAQSFKVGEAPWETAEQIRDNTEPVSGFQSFIRDIAEPALKLTASVSDLGAQIVGAGASALGREDIAKKIDVARAQGQDYGYFGKVKPLGMTGSALGDIKEAIGFGAELGSYAVGGGGGSAVFNTAKQGFKTLLSQGIKNVATKEGKQIVRTLVKEGAKEGFATGAGGLGLMSFGDSMQKAENSASDVAYDTLFGTVTGGIMGTGLGVATPFATGLLGKAKEFLNVPSLETKLAEGFKKILNPNARQIKVDTRFGGDSTKFLAQEMPDLPIQVDANGRIVADDALEMAKMKYQAEATAYKPIIRNSGKYINIDDAVAQAKAQARKEFDGSDLIKAEQQIDDEINAYLAKNPQDINVTPSGNRFMTLARADDIKSYSWSRGKGWGTPEAEVWNDTNNIIGHTLKDAIEKQLPDVRVKEMNRRLGQWKNAIDLLEKRQGQVSGSGKLAKYLIRSVGTSVGSGIGLTGESDVLGGLGGATAGFLTAGKIAQIMANPKVRLFAVRQLLQRLQKAGRGDMIQEAEQILKQQSAKYLLPAKGGSSYVEKPILVAQPGQKIESVGTQPIAQSKALSSAEPSAAPTIQDTINKNIPNTVDETVNKASQKGAQQVFGGVAGIEIKKDENGKLTVGFDPEKAVIGVIGMTAYNKFGDKIKNEIKDNLSKRLRERVLNELKNFDDNLVRVTGMLGNRLEGGDEGALLGLSRMKEKALTKNLSTSDINETIGLLKRQGVDLMKEETESALKSAQSATTNTLNASIKKAKASGQSFDEWVKGQATELNYKNLQENDYSIKAFGKDFNEPVEYFRAGQVRKNGDIWLTDNQAGAMQYSSAGGGTKVGRYIVQSKKPLIIDTAGGKYASGNIDINKILTKEEIAQGYTNNPDIKKKLIDYAKNNGYDAVQFADSFPDGEGGMRSLVVWDKNQVKTRSQLKAEWDKIK